MKNIFACTLIALGCMAGTAQAATEVHFLGAVNDITCDLAPEFGGAANSTVQLGTVAPNASSTAVEFALKPNGNIGGCAALTNTNTATVAWGGSAFDAQGLRNVSGTAEGARVVMLHKNAVEGANTSINTSQLVSSIKGDTLNADGFTYSAQLIGGATPGVFVTSAAYAVAYN